MKAEKSQIIRIVVVLGITLFILFSLWSFDTHDPPGQDRPLNERPANWCGVVGAYVSYFSLFYLGPVSSYLIVGLGCVWVLIFRFKKEKVKDAWLKVLGAFFLIVSISTLMSRQMFPMHQSSLLPSLGGHIGEALAQFLTGYFAKPGTLILLITAAALSLLLATDMVIPGLISAAFKRAGALLEVARNKRRFKKAKMAAATLSLAGATAPVKERKITGPWTPPPQEEKEEKREAEKDTKEEKAAGKKDEAKESLVKAALEKVKKRTRKEPEGKEEPAAEPARHEKETREEEAKHYEFPPITLLEEPQQADFSKHEALVNQKAAILERTLQEFGISASVVQIDTGPVITQYELELAPGVKVGKIVGLSNDIAIALKAPGVRIVAPIPGKSTVGIEVPNIEKDIVTLKELYQAAKDKLKRMQLPLMLGKDAAGNPLVSDLIDMPHLLIAGTTGSGKSVCLNAIISSLLLTRTPDEVKLILIDPKMVELATFKEIPHLICPVVTDMKKATSVLEWAMGKMDERYSYLARAGVRFIRSYNQLGESEIIKRLELESASDEEIARIPFKMPYIIIIVDELADLMMVGPKEIELFITRLAQKSRAVGIHMVLATQRPSVDVITGLIKSNLPSRIAFQVSSKVDSRTILDQNGAEKLLGSGDMLYLPPATAKLVRAQGTYVSEQEIRRLIDFLKERAVQKFFHELVQMRGSPDQENFEKDELYNDAVRIILETQRGSVSLLQRRLEIGYTRAARLIDMMYEDGIVGEYKGSQAREVLLSLEEWEETSAVDSE
jgi:S-DNA-T family DNA segregation ATPase FtsK/SpoIIIE